MAYVILPSVDEPSPYPCCKILRQLAPGQEHVSWKNVDGGPIPTDWQPRFTLHADYVPEGWRAAFSPDISFVVGQAPCLSAPVRDMIEALEPGIHQFFPVDIYNPDGTIREAGRFILNACQLTDAIVDGFYGVLNNGGRLYHPGPSHPLKIRRGDVSRLHLWRDKRTVDSNLFVSDQLYKQIADAGFAAFDLGKAEEI